MGNINLTDFAGTPVWVFLGVICLVFIAWFIFSHRSGRSKREHQLSSEYFKGLNHLLNDEQGKALDIFVKLVETNWETIDTHFALGKIFRKNGEIDKAIKIHQGLMARPSLPERYRNTVLLELGYDYLGAGWFDRAEGLFKEVLIHDKNSSEARHNLILIYQQEKDWHKAIEIAVDLFREEPAKVGPMISQYYCELADIAKSKGDIKQLEHYADHGLRYDADSVRSSILLADLAIKRKDYKKAIRLLQQIEKQDAEFIPVVLGRLIECYDKLGHTKELLKYLDDLEKRQQHLFLLDKRTEVIERYADKQAVISYITEKLKHQPSLQGMQRLIQYMEDDVDADGKKLLANLDSVLYTMQQDNTEYQCHRCGFHANTLYWLCPSCHSWGQVKPGIIETV